ncbi:arylamine N-acetyltransferase [Catellatospora sp. KI3]|uniref:arylamine N-acetyltransferase family protein n=1 Tax=Catellatospora sp. KI3 TaxID=3041620 RepID=UPI0024831346|nr:arylamine N-acetyltransferase [Catellatospora sp. KI3]MDI1459394.1 arylamine N-acetyltransferase [Catellatospora sp. KI3]
MIDAYLRLLGVSRKPPSPQFLQELHRAHVHRVPYTNMEIMLGRPGTVDQAESVDRVVRRRGGYCFQLNGAFAVLLRELGFTVTMHRGYVVSDLTQVAADLNHLALLVHDLPDEAHPDGVWFADTGLGDAFSDPLPLRHGPHRQGPFGYALADSPRDEPGWRLHHDPTGSFLACDIIAAPAEIDDFGGAHTHLSTSPKSPFTQTFCAMRRTGREVQILRGCVLTTFDDYGREEQELLSRDEWRQALADLFGLIDDGLDRLWPSVRTAHDTWAAKRTERAA